MLIQIVFTCFVSGFIAFAIYMFTIAIMKVPTGKATKILNKTKVDGKDRTSFMKFYYNAAKKIKISEYNRKKLLSALEISRNPLSPEEYYLQSFVIGGFCSLIGLIFFLFQPVIGIVGIFVGPIIGYFMFVDVFSKEKKYRTLIEREIPKFTLSISENLKVTRDVIAILSSYQAIANTELAYEIEKTLADMKSSNYEAALLRFDTRINSSYLSELLRGLIGCIRGNDQKQYFENLAFDMKHIEQDMIEKEAQKPPKKMHNLSLMLMFATLAIDGVTFATVLMQTTAATNF